MIAALVLVTALASTARVVDLDGDVTVVGDGGARAVERGSSLAEHERIRTGSDGHVRLLVNDTAVVDLSPNAELAIDASPRGETRIGLSLGRLWARVSHLLGEDRFVVDTPTAVAGVRGTSFFAEVDGGGTIFGVEAGAVEVTNRQGDRMLLEPNERLDTRTFLRTRVENQEFAPRERFRSAFVRSQVAPAREIIRQRREAPLDIDPGQARRYLERLRELRRRRDR